MSRTVNASMVTAMAAATRGDSAVRISAASSRDRATAMTTSPVASGLIPSRFSDWDSAACAAAGSPPAAGSLAAAGPPLSPSPAGDWAVLATPGEGVVVAVRAEECSSLPGVASAGLVVPVSPLSPSPPLACPGAGAATFVVVPGTGSACAEGVVAVAAPAAGVVCVPASACCSTRWLSLLAVVRSMVTPVANAAAEASSSEAVTSRAGERSIGEPFGSVRGWAAARAGWPDRAGDVPRQWKQPAECGVPQSRDEHDTGRGEQRSAGHFRGAGVPGRKPAGRTAAHTDERGRRRHDRRDPGWLGGAVGLRPAARHPALPGSAGTRPAGAPLPTAHPQPSRSPAVNRCWLLGRNKGAGDCTGTPPGAITAPAAASLPVEGW